MSSKEHDLDELRRLAKGCTIALIVSVPLWVGIFMLTSWLIGR
jgi:hypothetical protein